MVKTKTNFNLMIKSNIMMVGLSLFVLILFVTYLNDWFSLQNAINQSSIYRQYINFLTNQSIEVFIIIFIPFIGATIELLFSEKNIIRRDKSLEYMGFIVILLLVLIYPKVSLGLVDYQYPDILLLGLSFKIDMLAYTILLVSAFVWFYVIIYAHEYMKHEKHSTRFFFFLALTYASVLGTIMSGDLLTMFLFFEMMTLASYMLVIHGQNEEAYKAGFNYIMMGLIGGLMILTALLLIYFNVGDLAFKSAIDVLNQSHSLRYWVMGLLVLGFGIKAGMAPVHVWLPRAHPVAPTPASAILSGVMIKVGAFGIIRVATSYYFPSQGSSTIESWVVSQNVGAMIIWTGIFTMLLGVILALQQSNMKKILAYSSISQMGYILTGIGIAMYLGELGAMGYTGAIYHIINHALYKSLLFMVAGIVFYYTRELDIYKLGGLWRKLPLTTTAFVIGMFGIIGLPLFNGYVSKTILHHGLVEAYTYGSNWFILAEVLFILASIGTVCYFAKMFYFVFIKDNQHAYPELEFKLTSFDLSIIPLAIFIIWIGIRPQLIINQLIIPQLSQMPYDPYFISTYITNIQLFVFKDILWAIGMIVTGTLLFYLTNRMKLLQITFPKWLSFEYLFFFPAYLLMRNLCTIMYGDKCPVHQDEFKKLSHRDIEEVGFVDRFVITANVINRRYERSIIQKDAFIYVLFLSIIMVFFLISNASLFF